MKFLKEVKNLLTLTVGFDNLLGANKFDEETTIENSDICVLGHDRFEKSNLENSDYNLVKKRSLSLSLEKSNYNLVKKK